jgi:hypothetical protein
MAKFIRLTQTGKEKGQEWTGPLVLNAERIEYMNEYCREGCWVLNGNPVAKTVISLGCEKFLYVTDTMDTITELLGAS